MVLHYIFSSVDSSVPQLRKKFRVKITLYLDLYSRYLHFVNIENLGYMWRSFLKKFSEAETFLRQKTIWSCSTLPPTTFFCSGCCFQISIQQSNNYSFLFKMIGNFFLEPVYLSEMVLVPSIFTSLSFIYKM